eukprot:1394951-Amorphochlora_amoeboformis.AAC.1
MVRVSGLGLRSGLGFGRELGLGLGFERLWIRFGIELCLIGEGIALQVEAAQGRERALARVSIRVGLRYLSGRVRNRLELRRSSLGIRVRITVKVGISFRLRLRITGFYSMCQSGEFERAGGIWVLVKVRVWEKGMGCEGGYVQI